MGLEKNMTRSVELKLYAYRKNRDGLIVSFVVHPNDEDFLNGVHIGQVYDAVLTRGSDDSDTAIADAHSSGTSRTDQARRELTEGERLRTRAVLLCKDERFQEWVWERMNYGTKSEEDARGCLLDYCGIDSRSELALSIPAQAKFRELLDRYLRETGQAAEKRG
jgi:hypothetical protein